MLLHSTLTVGQILPFSSPTGKRTWDEIIDEARETGVLAPSKVLTLKRRPGRAAFWAGVFAVGAQLVIESFGHPSILGLGSSGFSPGCLLSGIALATGMLQYLGAGLSTATDVVCWILGSLWLFGVNE